MQLLQMTDSYMKENFLTVFWEAFACELYSAFVQSLEQQSVDHNALTETINLRAKISLSGALLTRVHTIRYNQFISSYFTVIFPLLPSPVYIQLAFFVRKKMASSLPKMHYMPKRICTDEQISIWKLSSIFRFFSEEPSLVEIWHVLLRTKLDF